MAKMVVFYALLNREETDIVNAQGWDSPIGSAYMGVTCFPKEDSDFLAAAKIGVYKMAAIADFAEYEEAFHVMNNMDGAWYDKPEIQVFTNFPRSMSVGDILFNTETGEWVFCASFGFKKLSPAEHGETIAVLTKQIVDMAARAASLRTA